MLQKSYLDIGIGINHSGVVIDGTALFPSFFLGRENSFGCFGGIVSSKPKHIIGAKFRESLYIGDTFLSEEEIQDVIDNLARTFTADKYDVISL